MQQHNVVTLCPIEVGVFLSFASKDTKPKQICALGSGVVNK